MLFMTSDWMKAEINLWNDDGTKVETENINHIEITIDTVNGGYKRVKLDVVENDAINMSLKVRGVIEEKFSLPRKES